MSETNVKKRKSKGKWHQPQSKKRKFAMCPGLKGFLLFCNNKERETIREAYNILNEYADQMYGQEDVLPKVSAQLTKTILEPWSHIFLFPQASFGYYAHKIYLFRLNQYQTVMT